MTKRDIISYIRLFNWLKEHGLIFDKSKSIIIDFEAASYNALKQVYADSQIFGCNFHLGQIVWRRVQEFHLTTMYKNSIRFKFNVKLILALSFVPVEKVQNEGDKLRKYFAEEHDNAEILKLYDWFKLNYINDRVNSNKSIEFWNVNCRTLAGIPRTTNSLEGLHRHFNTFVSIKTFCLTKILQELKIEQSITENHLIQSLYDNKKSKKEDMIKSFVENYDKECNLDYLTKIAINFAWKLD